MTTKSNMFFRKMKLTFIVVLTIILKKTIFFLVTPFQYLFVKKEKNERILVLRLDQMGDIILTSGFLRELRRNRPNAFICIVVKPEVVNLIEKCPYIDQILVFDWQAHGRYRPLKQYINCFVFCYHNIWFRQLFDICFIPRWDVDLYAASYISCLSGAKTRVSYTYSVTEWKIRSNYHFDWFFTDLIVDATIEHEAIKSVAIASYVGPVLDDSLEMWLDNRDIWRAQCLLQHLPEDKYIVCLVPGAGAPKRQWPVSKYREICRWLIDSKNACLVFLGGEHDRVLANEIVSNIVGNAYLNLVGITTLRETAAVLSRCHIYVGSDTGLMHMAAAVDVPVVEISCHPLSGDAIHYNSPIRFGPWKVSSSVVQPAVPRPPCQGGCEADHPHCIVDVTVEMVKAAISQQLAAINLSACEDSNC